VEEMPSSFLLTFLLPFHVTGGAVVGVAMKRVFSDGFKLSNIGANGFLLLWGLIFGGAPLVFGLSVGLGWFVALQVSAFLGAIGFVVLRYEWLRELYSQSGMVVATFGLAFLAIGIAAGLSLSSADEPIGLLVGSILGGVGAIVFIAGIWMMQRGR
jgi:hypothetical protein